MKVLLFLVFVLLTFVQAQTPTNEVLANKPVNTKDLPLFKQRHPKLYTVMQLLNKLQSRLNRRKGDLVQQISKQKAKHQKLLASQRKLTVALTEKKALADKLKKQLSKVQGENSKAKEEFQKIKKVLKNALDKLFAYHAKLKFAKGKFDEIKSHLEAEKKIVDGELKTISTLKKVVVTGAENANKKTIKK